MAAYYRISHLYKIDEWGKVKVLLLGTLSEAGLVRQSACSI